MSVIILDTGPLGLVTNPKQSGENLACYQWLEGLIAAERRVILPEIADYEIRRELLRAGKIRGLRRLDVIISTLEYLPITTAAMRLAADFWAQARRIGQPTAPNEALDGDVILAAQAVTLGAPDVVVVTTNVGHLSRFVAAKTWHEIDI
ncbi:MAG TPA: PIN domain-containing protein [Chthonomonadaceae bacterium]|nr:PIN domain-containing protein [Chthonomonadaceae bacterium]